jgi:hypothetical protein
LTLGRYGVRWSVLARAREKLIDARAISRSLPAQEKQREKRRIKEGEELRPVR